MGRTTRLLVAQFSTTSRRKTLLVLFFDVCLAAAGIYLIVQYLEMSRTPEAKQVGPANRSWGDAKSPRPHGKALSGMSAQSPDPNQAGPASGRGGQGPSSRPRRPAPRKSGHIETAAGSNADEQPTPKPGEAATQARPGPSSAPAASDSRPSPGSGGSRPPAPDKQAASTETGKQPAEPRTGGQKVDAQTRSAYAGKLRNLLRKNRNRIKRCYQKVLTLHGRKLSGNVHLQFELQADGTVRRVLVVQNTTGSNDLERCLLRMARGLRFPKPPGGPTAFLYPIAFTAKR